jgi:hypothetical protein
MAGRYQPSKAGQAESLPVHRHLTCLLAASQQGTAMHSRADRGSSPALQNPDFHSYQQAESVYLEWRERFAERMQALLPSLRHESVARLAESWYSQADHLEPEEAAEIAATWWGAGPGKRRMLGSPGAPSGRGLPA